MTHLDKIGFSFVNGDITFTWPYTLPLSVSWIVPIGPTTLEFLFPTHYHSVTSYFNFAKANFQKIHLDGWCKNVVTNALKWILYLMINVKLVVIKKFSQMIISGLEFFPTGSLKNPPEVDLIINCFLYKSINVYWPNGLAPTQYTDFDFYSSTSGNYTNWFGSEIFCFINFSLANENTRIGKIDFEPFHWSISFFSVASSCVCGLFLFATFDIGIDVFAGLESLFKTNHEVNTINNHLDQWEFRETKTISVGNIEHTTFGGCVDTT